MPDMKSMNDKAHLVASATSFLHQVGIGLPVVRVGGAGVHLPRSGVDPRQTQQNLASFVEVSDNLGGNKKCTSTSPTSPVMPCCASDSDETSPSGSFRSVCRQTLRLSFGYSMATRCDGSCRVQGCHGLSVRFDVASP